MSETERQSGGSEQRTAPRHGCSLAALTQVYLAATRERYFAWVHDVSTGGVALDMRTLLAPGQDIVCRLKGTRPEEVFEVAARVVQARFCDGLHRVGCK